MELAGTANFIIILCPSQFLKIKNILKVQYFLYPWLDFNFNKKSFVSVI